MARGRAIGVSGMISLCPNADPAVAARPGHVAPGGALVYFKLTKLLSLAAGSLLILTTPASAQQQDVTQFDAYFGYAFLNSPHIGLFENGMAAQVGFRPKGWYSVGFDYPFPGDAKSDTLPLANRPATTVRNRNWVVDASRCNSSHLPTGGAGAFVDPNLRRRPQLSIAR